MPEITIKHQTDPKNFAYYWIGIAFIVLNKIRHSIRGYTSPRPFPITQIKQAIEYDLSIVNHWLNILAEYTENDNGLEGENILELGPGADLGIGLIILAKGGRKYNAMDVNILAQSVPPQFYQELFRYIDADAKETGYSVDLDFLAEQLKLTAEGRNDRLNYVADKGLHLSIFQKEDIDLIFSQAAFEHFADFMSRLSKIIKKGAVLIAEVDLKTHTRRLRDVDPLNIYRYSDVVYSRLQFSGSPNRLRPLDYENIFFTSRLV